jgi:hypothetical protein
MVTSVGPSSFYVKVKYQPATENVIDIVQNIPQTLFIKQTQLLDFHYSFNTYDEEKESPVKNNSGQPLSSAVPVHEDLRRGGQLPVQVERGGGEQTAVRGQRTAVRRVGGE